MTQTTTPVGTVPAELTRTLAGAALLAERLTRPDVTERGITVPTGGTDVHLVLVDLRDRARGLAAAHPLYPDLTERGA